MSSTNGSSQLRHCYECQGKPEPCWQDKGDKQWYCGVCWDAFEDEKDKTNLQTDLSTRSGGDGQDQAATTVRGGGKKGSTRETNKKIGGTSKDAATGADRRRQVEAEIQRGKTKEGNSVTTSSSTTAGGSDAVKRPKKMEDAYVTESHIQVLEEEILKEATISFSKLQVPTADDATSVSNSTSTTTTRLRSILDRYGFAVVENVVDANTVAALEAMWKDDLSSILQVDPEKVASAPATETDFLSDVLHRWPSSDENFSLGFKFASLYGLPHGKCAWSTRLHPNVRQVYQDLYQCQPNELCVGVDNMFYNPKNITQADDSKRSTLLWPHADQCEHLGPEGKMDVFQSVLYLWPATCDTSATVVWPGSNGDEYNKLMAYSKGKKSHFCMMKKAEYVRFAEFARRIPVPSGGMLLWSSKTIHQGWPNGKRLAVPVCFEPITRRKNDAYKRKVKCVKDGQPTSHWASLGKVHSLAKVADDGGTAAVTLRHKAHLHALKADGSVKDEIVSLL